MVCDALARAPAIAFSCTVVGAPTAPPDSLAGASAALAGVMNLLQGADVAPTTVQLNAIAGARASASQTMAKWTAIKTADLSALNAKLKAAGLGTISLNAP
jgi:hypothetical protein